MGTGDAATHGRPIEITANGMTFSALEWGPADGRPVLLLHGFPQRATSWSAVGSRLGAHGLRAVAVDQRGYSPGAAPDEVAAYALGNLVADAVAIIEQLGGAVDLAGHDWGGIVGWQVASRHPERVRSWTAVSTPSPLALNAVLAVDDEQRKRFGYILVFRQEGRAEHALLKDDGAGLRMMYGGVVAADRVDADVAFFQEEGRLTRALNWYRAMSVADAAELPRATVPTTYIWGSEDPAFGRAAAERTGDFVDGPYTYVPLEGTSHWVLDQEPDRVAAEIIARTRG